MKMTFNDYIVNPMGRKNYVYSNRTLYANLYKEKLDKILVREVGKVKYDLYNNGDNYYIHMKIPSEVIPKFYYDTLIKFYPSDDDSKRSRNIKKYYAKFYSNDPSFVFTFAHSFIKNEIFIDELEPKMSKAAIKNKAKERNPKDEVGYVKSIYFAYLLMVHYNLFEKIYYETNGKEYDKKEILNKIEHADTKVQARIDIEAEIKKKKKAEKERLKQQTNRTTNVGVPNSTMTSSNFNPNMRVTPTVKSNSIKRTSSVAKTTRKTNKIGKR